MCILSRFLTQHHALAAVFQHPASKLYCKLRLTRGMNPVSILRFSPIEGPGYLGDFLSRQGILWRQINIDGGEAVPAGLNNLSGLVLMGGPMSVNDDLPWIPHVLGLIRQAVEHDIPVLGHCLGGQLMSKALGGSVTRNPIKEIGWGAVSKAAQNPAPDWLGELPSSFEVFHWHGETFSLPEGATRILESPYCTNQAWLLDNRHLALQCHIEMTAPMIRAWCENGAEEITQSADSPAVQSPQIIQKDMQPRLQTLQHIADTLYTRWTQGLRQT